MSSTRLIIGSNNRTEDRHVPGEGIRVLDFDHETGETKTLCVVDEIDNPSFLTLSPDGRTLYAVSEVGTWLECTLSAFRFDRESGQLTFLNKQPTLGRATCHVSVRPDGLVATANYSAGTGGPDQAVAIYRPRPDGGLTTPFASARHEGALGPRVDRQERNHAHSMTPSVDGHLWFAADLGTDEVIAYRLDGERLVRDGVYHARPGVGPRHTAPHPNGRTVYVMNEIDPSVSVLDWDGSRFSLVTEISTLPDGAEVQSWGADIHLSPDARHLYASTRVDNSLACFTVDEDGRLSDRRIVATGGDWPRNFCLTPSGETLFCANHRSNTITVFSRDPESGALTATGQSIDCVTPMCVLALA